MQTARKQPLPLPYYDKTADFSADYSPAHKTALDFSNAENPLGCSPLARQAILRATERAGHYPSPNSAALLRAIETHDGLKDRGLGVLATAGAGAAILLCVQALMKPGRHIAMPEASFPLPLFGATIGHGMGRMVRMGPDLSIDFNHLDAAVSPATAFAFLCNPNNPTGEAVAPQIIIDFARSLPCPLVVSEANADYTGMSLLDHPDLPENLIIVRSFSKIHGLAGLRVGYVVAAENMIRRLAAAHCPFTANIIAEDAAIAALSDHAHVQTSRDFMTRQREFLQNRIKTLGLNVLPSESNTMLVETHPSFDDAKAFTHALAMKGVTVIDCGDFCEAAARYIRISPRKADQNALLVRALEEVVA